MTSVRLAVLQMKGNDTRDVNVDRSIVKIHEAIAAGAQVICLQELFTGPYPCQSEDHSHFDWAEPIPGPTTQQLAEIAKKHQVVIVAPLFETPFASGLSQQRGGPGCRWFDGRQCIARCTYPTIHCSMKSFISLPGSRLLCHTDSLCQAGRRHLLGPMVSRGGSLFALAGAEIRCIRRRLVGYMPRNRPTVNGNIKRGKP